MSSKGWVFVFQGKQGRASLNGKWLFFEGKEGSMEWRSAVDLEEASHISFRRWPKSTMPIFVGVVFLVATYFGYVYTRFGDLAILGVGAAIFSFMVYFFSVGKLAVKIAMPNENLSIEGTDRELQEFYWLLEAAWISHRPSRREEATTPAQDRTIGEETPPPRESQDGL